MSEGLGPVSNLKKQGRRFKPGESGNPKGRTPGAKNRLTLIAENLVNDEAEAVMRVVVRAAKKGNLAAARLVLERAMPPRRGCPVHFTLPRIETTANLVTAMTALIEATATGQLTPEEANMIAGILEAQRRVIETVQLEARVEAIEGRMAA